MNAIRVLLVISTIAIYSLTVIASLAQGLNWPGVAIADLMALG